MSLLNRGRTRRMTTHRPACETLEGRELPSGLTVPASVESALIQGVAQHAIKTVPGGVAAIQSALGGGPGSEFARLVLSEVKNPSALLSQFESGASTAASIRGAAARNATILGSFTGAHYDYLAAVAAGAIVVSPSTLELGAILRGPNRSTAPAYFVFGIDRGAGAGLGPLFPARPGITPDALVTITAAPNNTSVSAAVTDLTTGAVTPLAPSAIQAKGSTLRVFVPLSELPSTGAPASQYRFAFWTQSQPGNSLANVGSFVPDSTMIPVGTSAGKGLKL
jgi:hypothetical protein